MPRRDALLIPDPSALPETLREPIGGVSCGEFFFVVAADLDRIPRPTMLAWLGVAPGAFERSEPRWRQAIASQLEQDESGFDEVYLELVSRALCLWDRPVAPLDRDVEVWIHYQRHAALAEQPQSFAERLGLTRGDELRLAHRFRAQRGDSSVAARATAALTGELPALPPIALGPLVFPPPDETA